MVAWLYGRRSHSYIWDFDMTGCFAEINGDLIKFDLQWELIGEDWEYSYIGEWFPYYVNGVKQTWFTTEKIWKRKKSKLEEMTLDEVCKQLWKDIKIIK